MNLLINHLGYEVDGYKSAVVMVDQPLAQLQFQIINEASQVVFSGDLTAYDEVDNWQKGQFYVAEFSQIGSPGHYRFVVNGQRSHLFQVKNDMYQHYLDPVLAYINQNRCQGANDAKDAQAKFVSGRDDVVDVSGAWYDASGDWSKYLSHLSFANYMNPQQIPMVQWSLLDLVAAQPDNHKAKDEAIFGADSLLKLQDSEGYFYMTIFDKWSKDAQQREICAYKTQQGIKTEEWQAAFRQGGGLSIAALARSARQLKDPRYLAAAVKGFAHLQVHNVQYCDNRQENIIDDYCALMAAVELYRSTNEPQYQDAAKVRVANLLARFSRDANYTGWLRADDAGERPFSHAVEEGFPAIALMHFYQHIEPQNEIKSALAQWFAFWQTISFEVSNPFGYVRHYVKPLSSEKRAQFFFVHENESGYWWQGENARLASIATACFQYMTLFGHQQTVQKTAYQQLNWLMGVNPFDACMLQGYGRNNPVYRLDWPGHTGGVCNGITSSLTDESKIALCESDDDMQNWRWGEQWIPHGAWWIVAMLAEASYRNKTVNNS